MAGHDDLCLFMLFHIAKSRSIDHAHLCPLMNMFAGLFISDDYMPRHVQFLTAMPIHAMN